MKPRVLLAEDNPADVYLIREALSENGAACDLVVAADGSEALQMIARDPAAAPSFQLIILDLNLPRHDGIEILEWLRQSGQTDIPVVVLTSSDSMRDREQAIQLGAARFLRKPSGLEQFLSLGAIFKQFLETSGRTPDSSEFV